MSNLPAIKLSGQVSDFNQVKQNEKVKQSNFYITVNTNQSYKVNKEGLENDTEVFEGVIKDVLGNINNYINLPPGTQWDDNTIKDVDIQYVVERGNQKGFLHCHALIKIKHTTNVKLNYKTFKAKIQNDLGLKNIYFKNYISKANDDNILNYIDKYVKKT